jgi:hypothetical protein
MPSRSPPKGIALGATRKAAVRSPRRYTHRLPPIHPGKPQIEVAPPLAKIAGLVKQVEDKIRAKAAAKARTLKRSSSTGSASKKSSKRSKPANTFTYTTITGSKITKAIADVRGEDMFDMIPSDQQRFTLLRLK